MSYSCWPLLSRQTAMLKGHSTLLNCLKTSFYILVLLFVCLTFSGCEAHYLLVTPSSHELSFCPSNTSCATLNQVATNASEYMDINVTLFLLPGRHIIFKTICCEQERHLHNITQFNCSCCV